MEEHSVCFTWKAFKIPANSQNFYHSLLNSSQMMNGPEPTQFNIWISSTDEIK